MDCALCCYLIFCVVLGCCRFYWQKYVKVVSNSFWICFFFLLIIKCVINYQVCVWCWLVLTSSFYIYKFLIELLKVENKEENWSKSFIQNWISYQQSSVVEEFCLLLMFWLVWWMLFWTAIKTNFCKISKLLIDKLHCFNVEGLPFDDFKSGLILELSISCFWEIFLSSWQ